jgi:predicted DNA-binding WGR domain protein
MTRYFTFSDDKSNKFWQLTTLDTTLTVTFGRVGTAGQSLTKTFDTPDRCEQEAAKLVREKTGKGYVETANGVAVAAPAPAKPKPAKPDNDRQALETILNRYNEIIQIASLKKAPFPFDPKLTRGQYEHQTFKRLLQEMLLPLMKRLEKDDYSAFAEKIKQVKTYWCASVAVGSEEYGDGSGFNYGNSFFASRYSGLQQNLIDYSAIGFISNKHGNDYNFHSILTSEHWDEYVFPVLHLTRPVWLRDNFKPNHKDPLSIRSYKWLRALEEDGLIDYEPSIFADYLAHYGSGAASIDQDKQTRIDYIVTDRTTLKRDIPSLFDHATPIHQVEKWVQYEGNPDEQMKFWPIVFARLLTEGKLDRLWFFERCLSVQTKDWPADLRSFYRKQIEANNPTTAEWLALQTNLFPLLAAQHPHVVSWAIGQLKTIYAEPDFRVGEMLDWATSAMMRADCKTALKTLLGLLERIAKNQPDHRPAIALLLADVFVISDLPLQTKVAQLLIKFADPADADLQTRLLTYAGQMLGNVATDLRAFLVTETEPQIAEASGPVVYQYAPPKPVQRLVPGQEVHLPETWNEFMFLIGKFIGSDDPLDAEILMNALILPPSDRPDDWREQLRVYEKKLEKTYSDGYLSEGVKAHFLHWLTDNEDETKLTYQIALLANRYQIDTNKVWYKLLKQAHQKRKNKSRLPLLSLSTHSPYWIAPKILTERLLAYQEANEPIEPLDLAIAIARMPREDVLDAIKLCEQLSGDVRLLMHYCLGVTNEISLPKSGIWSWLSAIFKDDEPLVEQQALWAVAARTFGPDDEFSAFAETTLAGFPNVQRPVQTKLSLNPPIYKLAVTWSNTENTHLVFLYGNNLSDKADYHYQYISKTDLTLWYSLISQQPEVLFAIVAKYGCSPYEIGQSLSCTLHLTLQPGFQFREMSLLVLACGLLAKKRETGALAAEVLIHHFGQQTLDATRLGDRLGWLLAGNYAPVQRLTDALNLVRDVSPVHNKALLLTLDALFAQLAAGNEPPKNTKKLLELYLDLLVKLAEKPTDATAVTLKTWQSVGALKAICGDILKQV